MVVKNSLFTKFLLILLVSSSWSSAPVKADFDLAQTCTSAKDKVVEAYNTATNVVKTNWLAKLGVYGILGFAGLKIGSAIVETVVPVRKIRNSSLRSFGNFLQLFVSAGIVAGGFYIYNKFLKDKINNNEKIENTVGVIDPKGPDKKENTQNQNVAHNGGIANQNPEVNYPQVHIETDEDIARRLERDWLVEQDAILAKEFENEEKLAPLVMPDQHVNQEALPENVEDILEEENPVLAPKPEQPKPAENPVVENQNHEIKKCDICLEDKDAKDMHKMSCCGKEYCRECLNENIDQAVETKDLNLLRCPNPDCKKEISENDLRAITNGNMDRLNKFNELKNKKIMGGLPGLKNCPTPGCDAIFQNEPDANGNESRQRITCAKCKKSYCASCLSDHAPAISCEQAKQRKRENLSLEEQERLRKEEAETAKLVRPCPRCHLNIEKGIGCKHMHCTSCGLHFCWDCLGHTPIDNDHKDGGYPHSDFYECSVHPELKIDPMQELRRAMQEAQQNNRNNNVNNAPDFHFNGRQNGINNRMNNGREMEGLVNDLEGLFNVMGGLFNLMGRGN